MTRIEREKKTVARMIGIYCRGHRHKVMEGDTLCHDCASLLDYASHRLDRCRYGQSKSSCRLCPVHCYVPDRRKAIRAVMRYSGPRMIMHAPFEWLLHTFTRS